MGKKRKHSEANVAELPKKDFDAPERPKQTLLGWKDPTPTETKETESSSPIFHNKELFSCSCRISYRIFILRILSLPHTKKYNKVESNESKGATLNELIELKNCYSYLYLWMAKCPNGPSVKFMVDVVHTMEELKLTRNHLKGSRPFLTFSTNFDKDPLSSIFLCCVSLLVQFFFFFFMNYQLNKLGFGGVFVGEPFCVNHLTFVFLKASLFLVSYFISDLFGPICNKRKVKVKVKAYMTSIKVDSNFKFN
ncbi:hypothetical protein PVL29_009238 [Vitis rotundifolia]|uniref:Brix domain-containing protein n=1 Tax=Vitis rotundifolia TaxID=103349 RepID=A0AA38ZXX0_VITRO|nr:hypothetical protein PVL29_009238 [Vitis rotundifolia]